MAAGGGWNKRSRLAAARRTIYNVGMQPLHGIRIVEAAQMISAPLATSILSDQGADVIKVEAADGRGDRMRQLGDIRNGIGSVFHGCNRGKRSITLDTKSDSGRAVLIDLIDGADVFVQNFRPGAVDRMGVGPAAMRERNPSLVYVSVSGFGATGPYADQMVYDFVIQGVTGLAAFEGGVDEDGNMSPRLAKNLVVDKATALTVSQGITAALLHRERTGEGQHLEIDMVSAGLQFAWPDVMWHHTFLGEDVLRTPHMSANYEVRPTKDGYVTLNLATRSTWSRVCAAVDPALDDDPRFATYEDRQRNADALRTAVDAVLGELSTAEVLARMRQHDLPGGPVLALGDVHRDPQIVHAQALVEHETEAVGMVREPRPAARFGAVRSPDPRSSPALGQHTQEILLELGYSLQRAQDLAESGVLG